MSFDLGAIQPLKVGDTIGTVNYRGGNPKWDLNYRMREVNPSGPVCVLVFGYRSRGLEGADNQRLMEEIGDKLGVSTLGFDYSGTTKGFWPDAATFDTYIDDAQFMVNALGDRRNFLLSKSMGVNLAFAAANRDTTGVIASVPAPDLFPRTIHQYFERNPHHKKAMEWGHRTLGAFYWKSKKDKTRPNSEYKKVTRAFWESAQNHSLAETFAKRVGYMPRMPVTIIANDGDKIGSPKIAQELKGFLQRHMHNTDLIIVSGETHDYAPETFDAVYDAVGRHAHMSMG